MTSEEVVRRLTIADPAFCRAVMATDLGEPSCVLDAAIEDLDDAAVHAASCSTAKRVEKMSTTGRKS